MSIKQQFVSGEIAKLAYEKGFYEECFAWYPFGDSFGIGELSISRCSLFKPLEDRYDPFGHPLTGPGDPYYPAPLFQQVIEWLGRKHNISIESSYTDDYFKVLSNRIEEALRSIKFYKPPSSD